MAKNKLLNRLINLWAENGDRMADSPPTSAKVNVGYVKGFGIVDEFNNRQYAVEEMVDAIVRERVASFWTQLTTAEAKSQIASCLWGDSWSRPEDDPNVVYGGSSTAEYVDNCVAFNSDNEPLLLALNNANQTIDVFNPRTLELIDTSDDLKTDLPSGSGETWEARTLCTDGDSVYVTFTDTNAAPDEHRIQAWDVQTWDVKSGWAATGSALPGTGTTSSYGKQIIVASADYLATANDWVTITAATSDAISIIAIADGTVSAATSGAGDAPTADSAIATALCSDGTNVFFIAKGGSAVYVCTATIADPTAGCGGAGYPLTTEYSYSGTDSGLIVSCGPNLIVSAPKTANGGGDAETDVVLRSHNATTASLDVVEKGQSSASVPLVGAVYICEDIKDLTFDGLNLWITTGLNIIFGNAPIALVKVDCAKLNTLISDQIRQLGDLTDSVFFVPTNTTDRPHTTFDGRDLWVIGDPAASQTNSGKMFRLPLVLLRN